MGPDKLTLTWRCKCSAEYTVPVKTVRVECRDCGHSMVLNPLDRISPDPSYLDLHYSCSLPFDRALDIAKCAEQYRVAPYGRYVSFLLLTLSEELPRVVHLLASSESVESEEIHDFIVQTVEFCEDRLYESLFWRYFEEEEDIADAFGLYALEVLPWLIKLPPSIRPDLYDACEDLFVVLESQESRHEVQALVTWAVEEMELSKPQAYFLVGSGLRALGAHIDGESLRPPAFKAAVRHAIEDAQFELVDIPSAITRLDEAKTDAEVNAYNELVSFAHGTLGMDPYDSSVWVHDLVEGCSVSRAQAICACTEYLHREHQISLDISTQIAREWAGECARGSLSFEAYTKLFSWAYSEYGLDAGAASKLALEFCKSDATDVRSFKRQYQWASDLRLLSTAERVMVAEHLAAWIPGPLEAAWKQMFVETYQRARDVAAAIRRADREVRTNSDSQPRNVYNGPVYVGDRVEISDSVVNRSTFNSGEGDS